MARNGRRCVLPHGTCCSRALAPENAHALLPASTLLLTRARVRRRSDVVAEPAGELRITHAVADSVRSQEGDEAWDGALRCAPTRGSTLKRLRLVRLPGNALQGGARADALGRRQRSSSGRPRGASEVTPPGPGLDRGDQVHPRWTRRCCSTAPCWCVSGRPRAAGSWAQARASQGCFRAASLTPRARSRRFSAQATWPTRCATRRAHDGRQSCRWSWTDRALPRRIVPDFFKRTARPLTTCARRHAP